MDGGAGYTSRGGLSARPRQDHVQISIDPGTRFDYDAELSGLRGDVARIKELAHAIDKERELHGAEINALEETMEKAKMVMGKAMRKLKMVSKQSRSWLMLYVVLFAIGMFVVVYILKKLYHIGKLVL